MRQKRAREAVVDVVLVDGKWIPVDESVVGVDEGGAGLVVEGDWEMN